MEALFRGDDLLEKRLLLRRWHDLILPVVDLALVFREVCTEHFDEIGQRQGLMLVQVKELCRKYLLIVSVGRFVQDIEDRLLTRPNNLGRFFPSFLSEMHGKGGNFCIFLLKIAEKEGKTDLRRCRGDLFNH